MVAKCGPRVLHHWAHKGRRNCDPWWENETAWHRKWKGYFPRHCREIHHIAESGEIHRADVKTPTGIYLEIQHSTMSDRERAAREAFYENLLWIVDGKRFQTNFDIFHMLPHPKSLLAADLVWYKARRGKWGSTHGLFWRLSETRRRHPDKRVSKTNVGSLGILVEVHSIEDIRADLVAEYRGHHQYDWIRPRNVWLDCRCPVFIDFGEDPLVKLETYDATDLPCIRYVSRHQLVKDVMSKSDVKAVLKD